MKRIFFFTAMSLLFVAPQPGSAQIKLDMNQITCGDLLGYSPPNQDFVGYWMSGYYNAAAGRDVLDYNRLQKNGQKVKTYCKKHKTDTLPTAIKKVAS
ncbi:MAG TPA: HdeA/HdeB family chaperone [Afipia sp.]